MVIAAVVWSQVVLVAAGIALWRQQQVNANRVIAAYSDVAKKLADRKLPEPIIIPPPPTPDLLPLLESLRGTMTGIAAEIAQGISLIVSGPTAQPQAPETSNEPSPADDPMNDGMPVEYPSWESAPEWNLDDLAEHDGEWSANGTVDPRYLGGVNG